MAALFDKPQIHALVGWYAEPTGLIGGGRVVPLEEAVFYHQLGAWVFIDPTDEIDLATWERQHRWLRRA